MHQIQAVRLWCGCVSACSPTDGGVCVLQKGDILLSVNGRSLVGLTHAQAVSALKSTAELPGVTLSVLEGPETCRGPAKFIPSWIYWQTLPR